MSCSWYYFRSSYYYPQLNENSIMKLDVVEYVGFGTSFKIVDFKDIFVLLRFKNWSKFFHISQAVGIYRLVGNYNHGGPYQTTWYEFLFKDENGLLYGNIPNPSFGKTPSDYYYRGYKVYWAGKLYYDVPLVRRCWGCDRGVPLETVTFSYSCYSKINNIKRILIG